MVFSFRVKTLPFEASWGTLVLTAILFVQPAFNIIQLVFEVALIAS